MTYLLAGLLTFPITTVLTIAGVGAAFVLIPVFQALGIELHQAMAIALLLNALAMISASIRYARRGLVVWRLGVPLIVSTAVGAPIGVRLGYQVDNDVIRIVFVCFLLFAAAMMIFSRPRKDQETGTIVMTTGRIITSSVAGFAVGVLAGLIGVGGGNIILPILLALGMRPREAVGTTALVVVFASLSGFASHVGAGALDPVLVVIAAGAAILGAILGSWLMTDRLNPGTIRKILAVVLVGVAIKMILSLV